MKIEIPLKEVQEFLSNSYHKDIGLKIIDENKIKVKYFVSAILTINEVKEDAVSFYYEVNGFVDLFAKAAHFLEKEKLNTIPVEWNSGTKEIIIDLKRFLELSEFLKYLYISELYFANENIILVLNIKNI